MVANGETALVNSDGTVLVGGSTVPEFNTTRDLAVTKLQGGDGAERRPTLNGKGTLMYRTTNDAEQISVSIRGRDGKLIVRCNGYAQGFAASKVKRIAIWAYGGNDHLTVGEGVTRAVYCEGGTGDDTLEGGMAGDVFLGGDGKDRLYGYDGDDILLGGGGNDYLLGGAGKDDLFGNGGIDSLSGAGGNDRLFGGIGDADVVSGGTGTDAAADSPDDVYSSIETILTL
jgi:Ca2+-binding RTX toxin-like protein